MMEIALRNTALVNEVYEVSKREGKAAEDFIEEAVMQQLWTYREKRIWDESQFWYSLPSEVRNQYTSKYVAVLNQEIVDSDIDRRTLYIRIHERFGNEPVMLIEGGDHPMPTINVRNVLRA